MLLRLVSLAALLIGTSASPVAQDTEIPGDETGGFGVFFSSFLPTSADAPAILRTGRFGGAHDPMRMLDNPGLLADVADGFRASGLLLPDLYRIDNIDVGAVAASGGREVQIGGQSFAVGVGVAGQVVSFDETERSDGDHERTVALGVGLGYEGSVRVRVGASGQYLQTVNYLTADGEERPRAVLADLSADVTAPVGRWIQPEPTASGNRLVLDLGVGYVLQDATLSDRSVRVPSPFSGVPGAVFGAPGSASTVGVSGEIGLDVRARTTPLRAVGADVFAESGEFTDAWGARLSLAETLTLSGAWRDDEQSALGVSLSVGGALRALAALDGDRQRYEQSGRFDLRYTFSRRYNRTRIVSPSGRTLGDASPNGDAHGLVLSYRP